MTKYNFPFYVGEIAHGTVWECIEKEDAEAELVAIGTSERLRKLEAVREAAIPVAENVTPENWCELQRALADCGDECKHVWLHDIRQLTTKENRCTLCGKPMEMSYGTARISQHRTS